MGVLELGEGKPLDQDGRDAGVQPARVQGEDRPADHGVARALAQGVGAQGRAPGMVLGQPGAQGAPSPAARTCGSHGAASAWGGVVSARATS
ncbi:hypothetical protein [Deinococcus multiflagellatus]|uniref:Uncharacterized protein n=1 Tax=Deinococcus multiflagellatus TaxID=1656887 RepID=A0ABW1ZK85_9DEIO